MNNFRENLGATALGYTTPRMMRGGIKDVVVTSY